MKVHHLNCATFTPVGGRLVSPHIARGQQAIAVSHCLLIETPASGLVLVDTGTGTDSSALGPLMAPLLKNGLRATFDPAESAEAHVRALGYRTDDVRHIVLTHLDSDHAGGLVDFPAATVHLSEQELEAVHRRRRPREFTYAKAQWAHGPTWAPFSKGADTWLNLNGLRGLPGLPPEIQVVPLPGHTRGHIGILVDLGRTDMPRWLLHAGDSHYASTQRDATDPHAPALLALFQRLGDYDTAQRRHTMTQLRELSRRPEVDIVCAHDADDLDRHLTHPDRPD